LKVDNPYRMMNFRKSCLVILLIFSALVMCNCSGGSGNTGDSRFENADGLPVFKGDWLIHYVDHSAGLLEHKLDDKKFISLHNGLISRSFVVEPNLACIRYRNLMTGEALLRGVKPEALITINGEEFEVGGLEGQVDYAYIKPTDIGCLTSNLNAFQFTGYSTNPITKRMEWLRKPYGDSTMPWPPEGIELVLNFTPPTGLNGKFPDLKIAVHYEIYDGIPLIAKWLTIENTGSQKITINSFSSELLAAVEYQVSEELSPPTQWLPPNIHVETDMAFLCKPDYAVFWEPDPEYLTQVHYTRETPCLLNVKPPFGIDVDVPGGESFESFRTWELIYDATDRERKSLSLRKMYRVIAPWVTENPIFMHAANADPEKIKKNIDQCAEVGFEMVIMTFGSGLDMENDSPEYIAKYKELAEYAHSRGIELGGYSLLASRRISDKEDVIIPEDLKVRFLYGQVNTGQGVDRVQAKPIFSHSPCLESEWGQEYFEKVRNFYEKTGMDILEHDGSYPGDVCASTKHPGHMGLQDSQWQQWKRITAFYNWCRGKGIYLNVPDWYFLSGSSGICMTYREDNNALPRERQIILNRQNIFDGTWNKPPSMGWMFVPLMSYKGGGSDAVIEPIEENLDVYEKHLSQNFTSGVQACYRGPRLYDTARSKSTVKKWVDFYKKYRKILDSEIIHLRRPDGWDYDAIMHVNPHGKEKGLLVIHNPLDEEITRNIPVNLYYTGLSANVIISEKDENPVKYNLDRQYEVTIPVNIPAKGHTWFVIR
jgi:hypothetical protein